MPRPLGVPADNRVDVAALARAGSTLERTYSGSDLPRLPEAGAAESSTVTAVMDFGKWDDRVTIDGRMEGSVTQTCQRCMQPVAIALVEEFALIVVRDDVEASEEVGGREPVVADPAQMDLRWLVEDQVLLALPLVPMHEVDECPQVSDAAPEQTEATQKPFGNLRDLMRRS